MPSPTDDTRNVPISLPGRSWLSAYQLAVAWSRDRDLPPDADPMGEFLSSLLYHASGNAFMMQQEWLENFLGPGVLEAAKRITPSDPQMRPFLMQTGTRLRDRLG